MKLGIPTLIELPNIKAHLELCKLWGLDFVEINMTYPDYQPENLKAKVIREYKRKYNIDFSLHLPEDLNPASFHSEVRHAYCNRLVEMMYWAAEAEIKVVNVHLPKGIYISLPKRKMFLYDEHFEYYLQCMISAVESIIPIAEKYGISFCIENCGDFGNKYQKALLESVLHHKQVGITWDVGHDYSSKYKDFEVIDKYIDKVRHIHLHDSNGQRDHLSLGTGEIDIPRIYKFSEERNISMVIEVKSKKALIRSISHLEQFK